MDPMHGTYLHSSSHSMAEGDRKADMVLQPTKTGFIFEKKRAERRQLRLGGAGQ